MESSLNGKTPEYLGADLTDRYSKTCRDVDVCGLTPGDDKSLAAKFWFWRWDAFPVPLRVNAIAKELAGTRAAMLDGPQGLAKSGNSLRVCERQSAAVGKTPDTRPDLAKPFAGFIRSSLDLFAALKRAGTNISPAGFVGGTSEVYPGHIWTILAGGRPLPKKSTDAGRLVRKRILEALGVFGLPILPTHDQNDACLSALIAAAVDGRIPGVIPLTIGSPLFVDTNGVLREGPMVVPRLTSEAAELIANVLHEFGPVDGAGSAAAATLRNGRVGSDAIGSGPGCISADDLLDNLIAKALAGHPQVYTYSGAYRRLFKDPYRKWSQAYADRVIKAARHTSPRNLPGLGLVRLDAFVVSKSDGLPSDGHWPHAEYDREDWERALGQAERIIS